MAAGSTQFHTDGGVKFMTATVHDLAAKKAEKRRENALSGIGPALAVTPFLIGVVALAAAVVFYVAQWLGLSG